MLRAAASLHAPSKQFKGAGPQEGSVARLTENLSRVEAGSAGVASGAAVKRASPPVTNPPPSAGLRQPACSRAPWPACSLGLSRVDARRRLRGGPSSSVT